MADYPEKVTFNLEGSPYSLEATRGWIIEEVTKLHERVKLLRAEGQLADETLRAYFTDKRFEQIAESNAIEGSTLDIGETQLAVVRGITLTGHDPSYLADAINLSRALDRLVELARDPRPTTLEQVKELHALILGTPGGSSLFRSTPVIISGSPHEPPADWDGVMSGMDDWEHWSVANAGAPVLTRAIVLHAWLTHIHPFTDGNGRTARAIMNLELVRGGFPSVIIRRRDRLRYYDALAESDVGGNLELIAELILGRAEDALRDLERAATRHQGYDAPQARLRQAQERQTAIWNEAIRLLFTLIEEALDTAVGEMGDVTTRWYDAELSTDDYAALSLADSRANSWLFRIDVDVPGLPNRRFLAWTGYRSYDLKHSHNISDGPSVFWSVPDPAGNRMWVKDDIQSPGVAELTLELPNVDRWLARLPNGETTTLLPSDVARRVATAVVETTAGS
ncbi:MAG: Fic family protein [Acidimicrobiaceae bacterium]|nr:Fic family protein [Acidimicrobiia bacterium]MCY4495425.1 Fic family protein [Acidimicrobiaceae bacterium]